MIVKTGLVIDDDVNKSTHIYYIAQCEGKECAKNSKTALSPIKKQKRK